MDSELGGGIAGSAVSYLLVKLDLFVTREWNLQDNIRRAVHNLGSELRSIEALLIDADSRREHDHQFTVWIQNVRDQAYDIEDVLDLFSLEQESMWRRLKMGHSINNLIQDIENRLQKIQLTKERYRSIASASTSASNDTFLHVRVAPLLDDNVDIVGITEPASKLVAWALQRKQRLEVMFVVGMAGLGKTTLVRNVFERVMHQFEYSALITASKSKSKHEILSTLLETFGCQVTQGANVVGLKQKLRKFLHNKRYVIVLDDFWVKDLWQSIKLALPDDRNDSRIIITTRRGDIAKSSKHDDSIHIHQLQPLSEKKAEILFYKKAFPINGRCPPSLENISKSILQKCGGLPLGIIEIGKVLSTKPQTAFEWKKMRDSIESDMRGDGPLSDITKVLFTSYRDLPYHLKYCFLYMSVFPENNLVVKRRRLIRLWIAEGFVIEKRGKSTLEEVGEEYLNELIDRNLIKVNEMDFDGRPISVGVHSLLLKMILSISNEENFCTVNTRNLTENTRRLSIQKEDLHAFWDLPRARTYCSFGIATLKIGSNFKLLKVVDIQGTPLDEFPSVITSLLLLRYLSLRNTKIKTIPSSLGDLRHLETLDLKQTLVTEVPKAVLQLEKLRHLLVYRYNMENVHPFDIVQGFKAPKRIGALKNLQKISFVKASGQSRISKRHRMIQGLDHLTQLRSLGVVDLAKDDGASLCQSIGRMRNLQSLSVTSRNIQVPLELDDMINPPSFLQRLYLKGPLLSFPNWVSSLDDLVRIRLKWSSLTRAHNPVNALQDLPNLMELQLLDAYTGAQMDFCSGKFQKLKILDLQQLKELNSITIEEGALPCLQKLIIGHCSKMVQVPRGIDRLIQLQMLLLYDMPPQFMARLKKNGGQSRLLVQHIRFIHSYEKGRLEDLS